MKKTDLINKNVIKALNPCTSRFDNFITYYPDFNGNLQNFLTLDEITYSDKVWVFTRLFTKEQNVKWSLLCASSVLKNFEVAYPNDNRPRLALEAVQNWLHHEKGETNIAAQSAARSAQLAAQLAAQSAYSAARSVESTIRSAAWSAESAVRSAAYSVAYSAYSTAYLATYSATWSAAELAYSAARSVESTIRSAAWSAESDKNQEELTLIFARDVLND
ncbi:MAG: putative immunity protein [Turicibacter sp.]